MQRRYPVSKGFLNFPEALAEKKRLVEENPKSHLQVRRYKNGFRVMERLETNEAQVIHEMRNGRPKKKRRARRAVV